MKLSESGSSEFLCSREKKKERKRKSLRFFYVTISDLAKSVKVFNETGHVTEAEF